MPPQPETDRPLRRRRPARAVWPAVGVLVFAVMAVWSLAVPLMASPDETSHAVKAAAVARGQWSGELGPPPVADLSRPAAGTLVQLPNDLAASLPMANCYAFQPEATADCVPQLPPRTGEAVPVETFAGQYPPLYYGLVGWPSLLLTGEAALHAMRLASAALSAVMLTWGAYRLSTVLPTWLGAWAAVVAITPMCLFLAGTINPNGWEIVTGFSFWAACVAVVSRHGAPRTGDLVHATVAGALLVNIRESSPVWALAIVGIVLLLARPGRAREVVRHRLFPWLAGVAALASGSAVAWYLTHGGVVSAQDQYPRYADPQVALLAISGRSYEYLRQMIGDYGWLDTPAPPITLLSWFVAVGALVLIALSAAGRARARAALALLLVAVAAAPLLQLPTVADAGLIWQGRYVLPVAVGIPVVSAVLITNQRPEALDLLRRVFRATLPVLVVGHVAAFYWASRRYSEGASGDLFTTAPNWSSPVGYLSGIALYALLCLALSVIAWRSAAAPAAVAVPAVDPAGAGRVPAGSTGAAR